MIEIADDTRRRLGDLYERAYELNPESPPDLAALLEDEDLPDRLWAAIRGRGAFRRFKDVLYAHPAEQERWYAFQDQRLEQRVVAWLAEEGIEPLPIEAAPDKHPAPQEAPQEPAPPARSRQPAARCAAHRADRLAGHGQARAQGRRPAGHRRRRGRPGPAGYPGAQAQRALYGLSQLHVFRSGARSF